MKPGRNDPCPCGSGKKFKHCCEGKIKSLSAEPAPAEFNQLVALYNSGQYAQLESQTLTLIERHPSSGFAWKLLSCALLMQGKEALPVFQKTAQLMPDDAEAHNNLGVVLKNLGLNNRGLLNDAIASYRRALEIKPDYAEAHYNLGIALNNTGQFADAAISYRRALKIKPNYAEAHNDLGTTLYHLGQFDQAVANFRRAVQINPHFAGAHSNLGNSLSYIGQFDEAAKSYRRALDLQPDFTEARSNLLLALNYNATLSPASYLAEARLFGQVAAKKVSARFTAWRCPTHSKPLRIGLISGELYTHPVGHFLENLLRHIDPTRLELAAYPTQQKEDALSARIKPYFAAWKPLTGLSDEAAAKMIHSHGVQILIDLAGHTSHNRLPLFAWKPAPVQFSWIGLPATTGVAEMDYVLGDPVAIPVEDEGHFSENVWRLPESYLCFTPPDVAVEVGALPAFASGQVTFGSFNNLAKMSDATVAVWARILHAVTGSRLFLKTKQLQDATVLEATFKRFAAHGIEKDRLLLEGFQAVQRTEHLAAYQQVDIALDTFPYPGVTTSVEALWMGVPVLTLRGDRFLSRTADSIAHNVGLVDWVAADGEDYVAKAVFHAAHLEQLAALRASLRQQLVASPLCDAPRFARNFEGAVAGMWQKYVQRTLPAPGA